MNLPNGCYKKWLVVRQASGAIKKVINNSMHIIPGQPASHGIETNFENLISTFEDVHSNTNN